MPEITHQKLPAFLEQSETIHSIPVYLFHGDEFLYKNAMQEVLRLLIPGEQPYQNCIVMDGGSEIMSTAIAELNTFSLLEEGKVVVVNDAKIFSGQQSKEVLIDKIESALAQKKPDAAARYFLNFIAFSGFTLDDLNSGSKLDGSSSLLAPFADQDAMEKLIQYCRKKKIKPDAGQNQDDFLQGAIEKGFPDHHHLIITTEILDRRKKLFKAIKELGLVVDCSVPKGERKADKEAQAIVLKNTMASILNSHGKSIEPAAYHLLCEMTGFDLPTFSQNLKKLVAYVGGRAMIETRDVTAVVERSRQDPIFAFTNAILDRNAKEAVFFLDSLLHQEMHPLQVLTAMIKQIRNILIAKDFTLSPQGKAWSKGCSYGKFSKGVLPAIEAYDQQMMSLLDGWNGEFSDLTPDNAQKGNKKVKKHSSSVSSDLRLAKNPKSPYPIYQLMLRTENFSRQKVLASLEKLSQADYQLKTTSRSPKIVLEDVIFFICNSI